MTSGKICVVTRHQYEIFPLVLFRRETSLASRNASCFTRLRSRRIKNYNNIFTFCGETSLPSRNGSCFTKLKSRRIKNYNNIFTFCGETSLASRNASCFTRLRSRRIKNYNNIFTDGNRIDKESCTIYKLSAIGNVQSLVTFHPIWP